MKNPTATSAQLSKLGGGQDYMRGLNYHATMRRNVLNWCNLVSISKKLMFYVFGVVRIY